MSRPTVISARLAQEGATVGRSVLTRRERPLNGIQRLTALASATAALVFAAPITALPPAPATGTGAQTSAVITSVRAADGNTHIEIMGTGVLAGTVRATLASSR